MNTIFHRVLTSDRVAIGLNTLDVTIPEAPMILPLANNKVTAESPVPIEHTVQEFNPLRQSLEKGVPSINIRTATTHTDNRPTKESSSRGKCTHRSVLIKKLGLLVEMKL